MSVILEDVYILEIKYRASGFFITDRDMSSYLHAIVFVAQISTNQRSENGEERFPIFRLISPKLTR